MSTRTTQNAISAGQARKQLGTLLDKAFYQQESFIVERAGQPRAVIVPLADYRELQRRKREARERFWATTDQLRERFSNLSDAEIQKRVDEAVAEVRANPSPTP